MKVFVFDANKCNGCYNCQLACKDEHCDNDWPPYSKPQPVTGHFWMNVKTITHGQVPKVRLEYRPVPCQHCDHPVCAEHSGAFYKRQDGLVILDPAKAGDPSLTDACPYGTVYWNEELKIAQKCSGCAHLVDAGALPHCVDCCVLGALRFGEEEEFAAEIAQAELFHPEFGTKPRMYYLNMPHLFLGGEVWDPACNEIIQNAKVTLAAADAKVWHTETDEYGDFWFRKLNAGDYDLKIEAEGFQSVAKAVKLQKSLNIGDFALEKLAQ